MTQITLYNTMTRKKELFAPLDPANVRMYVCGPTVYDRAHLGNARPVLVFDVLFRLLRHVYGPDHVTYVRNFTDVDDKIIARAAETGREIGQITSQTTQWYLDDMAALGALEPTEMPHATAFIPQMVAMIGDLVAKGHAYAAEGHVLFAVDSYAEYGALSGRSTKDMIAGARVEVAPYKKNPMDFVLWKPSNDDQPGWDSPWGRGRPGWHIECSAMAEEILMKDLPEAKKSFDIHGGGNDLQFPHHENEIAQSKCAHPEGEFARVWMHNEMLQVEGRKMSKSLGNFFTVHDLLEQGVPGEVIRFVMLSTHYRKPMDWTERKREEAEATLRKWRRLTDGVEPADEPEPAFLNSLCEDLNTPLAISHLHAFANPTADSTALTVDMSTSINGSPAQLKCCARILGFLTESLEDWEWRPRVISRTVSIKGKADVSISPVLEKGQQSSDDHTVDDEILSFLQERDECRKRGKYQRADEIRELLSGAGIQINDAEGGLTWEKLPHFDPAKLEALK
ncbi:MAG: cysteine--tRNA ligase [Rhodobacteraceae bacterium]|nr:cysteine--tRNA ligase [Paracoccaceae bacterium]